MIGTVARLLRREVDQYVDTTEVWRRSDDQTLNCFDFEELLDLGVRAFHKINKYDENWRRQVFAGTMPYAAETDEFVGLLYRVWSIPGETVLAELAKFEAKYEHVPNAIEFRRCCREVAGILTPDEEFFSSDRLTELRDQPVEEHLAGKTSEPGTG